MKIIDNKKDYYDYVVGEYGIDNLMIFDRRKSFVVYDVYGNYFHYVLKAGNFLYYFEVERFFVDNEHVKDETFFLKKEENKEGIFNDLVLAIIPFRLRYYFDRNFEDYSLCKENVIEDEIINLPILKNTPIPKFIPAKEIFLNIYSFISSQKDIKIEDKRTDIQKLQSAGFDKIESFRNIK